MGAGAGHIKHIYENLDLSFNDVLNICEHICNGSIISYEKVDGQNLMITVKNGLLCGARNKTQLKNPIPINDIPLMFQKYPHALESFKDACLRLTSAFNMIDSNILESIFCYGTKYLNIEIVNQISRNIVDYNHPKIVFNNLCTIDATGTIVSTNTQQADWFHSNYFEIFRKYSIAAPIMLAPIGIFDRVHYEKYLKSFYNISDLNLPIKAYPDIKLIETIISILGNSVLNNFQSSISNEEDTTKYIQKTLHHCIEISKGDPTILQKITPHINKIMSMGGFHPLPTFEGIVFIYNGTIYKITGKFAPINQILGYFKYSR